MANRPPFVAPVTAFCPPPFTTSLVPPVTDALKMKLMMNWVTIARREMKKQWCERVEEEEKQGR